MPVPLRSGQRVVVQAKPTFWTKQGSLLLEGRQIRPVGEGELLARVEQLKRVLAAEGVFDRERKRRPPFLPEAVGLICGRGSAAERDVVENARRRWPAVRFEIREVPVQGSDAVLAVAGALAELDALAHVEVIVIARGGGSFEDLLPFSNEAMVRAVAAARTPVVSAIGHEVDTPLLDFVADVRASTPTDAAKRIVPDVAQERSGLDDARLRLGGAVRGRLAEQRRLLATLRSRPVLRDPAAMLAPHRSQVDQLRGRADRSLLARTRRGADEVGHLRAQVRALSPLSTLQRGYAVVEHADGRLVSGRDQVEAGELLRVRVADGDFGARVVG
jgi:exodeoxyribonuclease VII large subunit